MKKHKIADMKSDLPKLPKEAPAPKPLPADEAESEKMRLAEMDLDHLMKAHDIQMDSERMERVGKVHGKRMGAMRSIADLKLAGQALALKTSEKARYPKREK